jgi:hypothetical protein
VTEATSALRLSISKDGSIAFEVRAKPKYGRDCWRTASNRVAGAVRRDGDGVENVASFNTARSRSGQVTGSPRLGNWLGNLRLEPLVQVEPRCKSLISL